jgi:hypothetical protein
MKMEQIECSETSAYKIQTPGNYPEENIQRTLINFPGVKESHCLLMLSAVGCLHGIVLVCVLLAAVMPGEWQNYRAMPDKHVSTIIRRHVHV